MHVVVELCCLLFLCLYVDVCWCCALLLLLLSFVVVADCCCCLRFAVDIDVVCCPLLSAVAC